MSNECYTFALRRLMCTAPCSNKELDREIDVVERSVARHTTKCEDAKIACGSSIASMSI